MARRCCKYFTVSLVPVSAILLAILFAVGILALPIIYTELAKKYEYGIVIDAGSSHTKVFIYELNVPITGKLQELDSHKSEESLNDYVNNPKGAKELVNELVQKANDSLMSIKVPSSVQRSIRLYLGATAGMRLLRRKDNATAEAILESARAAFNESGYRKEGAVIISGVQEAASGWATANYILDPEDGFVGAVDMGGASTQISFPAKWPESAKNSSDQRYYVTERVMNKTEYLYARSYLCYGHNEAEGRFLAHLIDKNNDKTVNVSNPCLAKGLFFNYTFSEIYCSCANDSVATEVFGSTYSPPSHFSKGENATFLGEWDAGACWDAIHEEFDFYKCRVENCDQEKYQPPQVNGTVVGFSGMHYIANKLSMTEMVFNKTNSVKDAVVSTCNTILKSGNDTAMCFYGMYMAYMVERGFWMNSSSPYNWSLEFVDKKDDKSFGWAMGYYMNKTYEFSQVMYHEVFPYSVVDMIVGMLILTILCVIFVVFFFLTFYACKKALSTHDGYQSIS